MDKILIIDDDPSFCKLLKKQIKVMGHHADLAYTLADARQIALAESFDVIYLDVRMPDGNGLDALPDLISVGSAPEVIIVTGKGDPDGAALAIENNAWDYIQKGASFDEIVKPLDDALQYRKEKLASTPPAPFQYKGLIGNSKAIHNCMESAARAALSDMNIFITGATGTGKGLFARAIHHNSRRGKEPFLVVDCASLKETLAESALFGHRKGSFTGAVRDQIGLIEQADRGTLFLDEIGELELSLQKKFLKCLEDRRFRPVGGSMEVKSDFRLIAATSRDINAMIQKGAFRRDLLFRVMAMEITLPCLRDRSDDIPPIVQYHIDRICKQLHIKPKTVSQDFYDFLNIYHWPGNIRELINALDVAISAAQFEKTLFSKHLPKHIRIQVAQASIRPTASVDDNSGAASLAAVYPKLKEHREKAVSKSEKEYLAELLQTTGGNIKKACEISGLSRSRLFYLRKKHGL